MPQRKSTFANLDWSTVSIYLLLMLVGWINIYAAVYDEQTDAIFDFTQRYGKQLVWIGAAILIAFITLILEPRFFVFFAYPIYGVSIFLLIAVLFVGVEIQGARSWFTMGGVNIQPSEFAKFATALALAKFISSYNFKMHYLRSKLVIFALIGMPALLIFLENDTGSALVYAAFILVLFREGLSAIVLFFVFLAGILFIAALLIPPMVLFTLLLLGALVVLYFMIPRKKDFGIVLVILTGCMGLAWIMKYSFLSGTRDSGIFILGIAISSVLFVFRVIQKRLNRYYLLIFVFLGALVFTFSVDYVFTNVLEPHHQARINELLGIESDPLGAGYNVNQSKIAIGSGGFSGKGFLKGTQTKFNFVPEQSTDFIFCTVGEEWGFLGTTFITILFLLLFSRIILLAERQRSVFSRVYGYSVALLLFIHFCINIGMTIGLMPVIGIPLPFISYGGSSLWSFTILLFIFLRLDASRLELFY
jgi:rod shape determining protein RodA